MSDWSRFNDQFRETDYERHERWKATKAKRTAEGKCWKCAELVVECKCPNATPSIPQPKQTIPHT
jgi:hypothetical protein